MRIFLIILATALTVSAAEFHVDKERDNMVKFISDAPLEDFEGITDQIDGYVYYEGEEWTNASELYFEVDLNSIDTGIGLRNRHMRENYLHTDKYPITYFSGKIISVEDSTNGIKKVITSGKIFIHGIEKPLETSGTLTPYENGFRIKTSFSVMLSDFNIEIPQIMFMKIDEEMRLRLDFFIKNVSS